MTEEVDISGLLRGGRLRLPWKSVALSGELAPAEWDSIECFQVRAREFLLNVADLRLPNIHQLSIDRSGLKATVEVGGYPGRHRAKSLFVDFRHLLADKEIGTFRRVRNVVRYRTAEESLGKFLDQLDGLFLPSQDRAIEFMGTRLSPEALLRLWFNTEFFHTGNEKQQGERERMLEKLEADGAAHFLFWTVVQSAHPVKGLYACVKDLRRGSPSTVRCPDRRIVSGENIAVPIVATDPQ